MEIERHVRLFRPGGNQVLRIPRDLEFSGDKVTLHGEGNRLVLVPVVKPLLLTVLASLKPIDMNFPISDNLPPGPVTL